MTYPLSRPETGNDERFTFGLVLDVAKVLTDHGYPDPNEHGGDFVQLQQALFCFLYEDAEEATVIEDTEVVEDDRHKPIPQVGSNVCVCGSPVDDDTAHWSVR